MASVRARRLRTATLLPACLAWGCAGAGAAGEGAAAPDTLDPGTGAEDRAYLAPSFERVVAPFEVTSAEGVPYEHPFLGGLNVPRPQLADIDGDGDLDLFVQERTFEVMYFENVGTSSEASFVWRTDRFRDLRVGDWNRLVDFDGDGDLDVFAEERYSHIRYYRNTGTPREPRFELVGDSVRDAGGAPIFSDRQNIPFLVDLDCDGLMDLFLGRIDGTVTRYEEVEGDGGPPRFELVADDFEGIRIVGELGGTMHGANSMVFGDYDRDGDPDLLWGDFFEPSLLLIENVGTCEAPDLTTEPVPFPTVDELATSGYNASWMADVDGDGHLELFVGVLGGAFDPNRTSVDNLHLWRRRATGFYELVTRRYLTTVDVGTESAPALLDLDGDGDLDLLIGNKLDPAHTSRARLYHFENVGDGRNPRFALRDTLDLRDAYHYVPAAGDLDGDGVAELLLGTWRADLALYRLAGSGATRRLELVDSAFVALPRAGNAVPALGDLDGDGDLDLLVGEAAGNLNHFENVGSSTRARFELRSETFLGLDVGRRSAPGLADVDGDGDLDLTVGSEAGGLRLLRNDGTPTEPRFVEVEGSALPLHGYSIPVWADIDGDGDVDLFAGDLGGGLSFWENVAPNARLPR